MQNNGQKMHSWLKGEKKIRCCNHRVRVQPPLLLVLWSARFACRETSRLGSDSAVAPVNRTKGPWPQTPLAPKSQGPLSLASMEGRDGALQPRGPLDRSPSVALGADQEKARCPTAPALLNVREHMGLRCSLQVYRPTLPGGFKPLCTLARHYSKSKYSRIKLKDLTPAFSFFLLPLLPIHSYSRAAWAQLSFSSDSKGMCSGQPPRSEVVGKYPLSLVSTPQISALAPRRLLNVQETIRRRKTGRKLRLPSQMKGRF